MKSVKTGTARFAMTGRNPGGTVSGRVTIKSIAADLGISHMTVSRALSGHPNVQKETREAVQNRARELGYVKSAAAKAMRGDGTRIVGLLLPNIINEFYARFANTMALACEAADLQLIIHLTGDDSAAEGQALDRLREVQAQAVVMVPCPPGSQGAAPFPQNMQVIQLIREREGADATSALLVDEGGAIGDAVRHLAQLGHRCIAYVGADSDLSSGRTRLSAFRQGIEAAGLIVDPAQRLTGVPTFETGQRHTKAILADGQATALICGGFEISHGALSALMEAGVLEGGAFAFVGYGDPSFYAWVGGGVTTLQVPVDALAKAAVDLLSGGGQRAPVQRLQFPAHLVVRGRAR